MLLPFHPLNWKSLPILLSMLHGYRLNKVQNYFPILYFTLHLYIVSTFADMFDMFNLHVCAGLSNTRCNTDPRNGEVNDPCSHLYDGVCVGGFCTCPPGKVRICALLQGEEITYYG